MCASLTEQHTALLQQVAEVFEDGALVLTSGSTEIAEEPAAGDHHVGDRVLETGINRKRCYNNSSLARHSSYRTR